TGHDAGGTACGCRPVRPRHRRDVDAAMPEPAWLRQAPGAGGNPAVRGQRRSGRRAGHIARLRSCTAPRPGLRIDVHHRRQALVNGWVEVVGTAYGVSAVGMLIGLLLRRADSRAYWRWPVYSAMAMAVAAVTWNLLVRRMLPETWPTTHPRALYFCALGLYS